MIGKQPGNGSRLIGATVIVAIVLLIAVSAVAFLRVFPAEPFVKVPPPVQTFDATPMQKAMTPGRVGEQQTRILSFGSRFMGQPGAYKCEQYIRQAFDAAGLEVYSHGLQSVAANSDTREIYRVSLRDDGTEELIQLDDVEIYPFLPNHTQPMVTPDSGISGPLIVLDSETLRGSTDLSGCIGLIDCRDEKIDQMFGFDWVRYARLGVKALIVAHPEGLKAIPWYRVAAQRNGMVSSIPVNYVRLAAGKEIFKHTGEVIHLKVKTRFVNTENTTIVGVLRAEQPADEALIIASAYDARSILPDSAPGSIQAVTPAVQLQLLQGLLPYRESLRRDVIFISFGSSMMSEDGLNNLLRILHKNFEPPRLNPFLAALGLQDMRSMRAGKDALGERRIRPVVDRQKHNDKRFAVVEDVLAAFEDEMFIADRDRTEVVLATMNDDARALFIEQFSYVMDTIVLGLSEPKLQAKIAFERLPTKNTDSDVFQRYLVAKRAYDEASSAAGYSVLNLLKSKPGFVRDHLVRARCLDRFRELRAHHLGKRKQLEEEVAIVGLFDRYRQVGVVEPKIVPGFNDSEREETLSLHADYRARKSTLDAVVGIFRTAGRRIGSGRSVTFVAPADRNHGSTVASHVSPSPVMLTTDMWTKYGYPTYLLVSFGRREAYRRMCDPVELPFMREMDSLRGTFAVLGETVLSMAHGNGTLEPVPFKEWIDMDFGGQVLVSNVGQSIVPNYPLKHALVACRSQEREAQFSFPGYYRSLMLVADVYGRYELPHDAADFPVWRRVYGLGFTHTPVAVGYGDDGMIRFMKDESEDGQRLFKSVNLSMGNRRAIMNVSVVTFRASAITVLDLTNPQTMKDYTSVDMISQHGLVPFQKECRFQGLGLDTSYLEPDQRFFVKLQSGAPGNELTKMTRAFMLGIHDDSTLDPEKEIDGDGYLVADFPFLLNVPAEVARSMAYVNGRRLALQDRYGMTDERTGEYHRKCLARLEESGKPGLPPADATKAARAAVTYATLNHPVIRESVMEAVLGVLWYLALLVPFVFFFEKLVFCFPDVRKQIAAQSGIFLVVFTLLRILHPAFQMVRSSIMILLGFVIILISSGITILFSSKFRENLEELREKQGKVSAAEINTLGVMGTAFMLGLNNMHRRKMRTGLTCGTLTLITFVMICFTSVQDDLVDEATAMGKAIWQGMLVKRETFLPLSEAEVFAFREKYGDRYDVCERRIVVGEESWYDRQRYNPELTAVREMGGVKRQVAFDSLLQLNHNDPLQRQVKFLTSPRWFTEASDQDGDAVCPVLIPDAMASDIGVSIEAVNASPVPISINNRQFEVIGIFESESLDALRDLDGLDILPFDIENMALVVRPRDVSGGNVIIAEDDDPRIPASRIVITPVRRLFENVPHGNTRIVSVAISMPDAGYKEAKDAIDQFLEQTGEPLYYGLDGIAYKGKRTREVSLAGLVDLIIPLIIAGMTVLNTMRGSVYERRNEIFVYNAVGIAPRFVFFIFFAEAFVYVVVGSVLGYVLSQGTGRILTVLDMTGGLNMTFTSISTIYASLTIGVATFASTYFPARSAMEISAPAEDAGWALPEPEEDLLSFDLPFSFRAQGRIAILAFFDRYLQDHGEGSAGRFFAGSPEMAVQESDGGYVPQVTTTIWLKPFDLAVSQRMTISIPDDPETGQYKAHIAMERLSGTRESWMRLNRGFVALVRRHFLHWRAVTPEQIAEMFEEAKERLKA